LDDDEGEHAEGGRPGTPGDGEVGAGGPGRAGEGWEGVHGVSMLPGGRGTNGGWVAKGERRTSRDVRARRPCALTGGEFWKGRGVDSEAAEGGRRRLTR